MTAEKGRMMKPILNEKNAVVAYGHQPNANRTELRSRSGGLLAWSDRNTDQAFDAQAKRAGLIPNHQNLVRDCTVVSGSERPMRSRDWSHCSCSRPKTLAKSSFLSGTHRIDHRTAEGCTHE